MSDHVLNGVGARVDRFRRFATTALAAVVAGGAALIGQGCSSTAPQTTFDSPQAAVDSLVAAVRASDSEQIKHILGPEGEDVISSGDDVADHERIDDFLHAYDEKHVLTTEADGSNTLSVGAADWPMPIPIVNDGGKWSFDTEAGLDEILSRRIGENELSTIQTCLAIVDAQREYVLLDVNSDGLHEYARKLISDPGQRNGLYWPVGPGEPESPLGPLVADAAEEGYGSARGPSGEPRPYHGYHYRLLTAQGASAPSGAMNYDVNGRLIGGFAAVAYPADYGNSGIMTFIVNHAGDVYQADLGPGTESAAKSMKTFDPSARWRKVEEADVIVTP